MHNLCGHGGMVDAIDLGSNLSAGSIAEKARNHRHFGKSMGLKEGADAKNFPLFEEKHPEKWRLERPLGYNLPRRVRTVKPRPSDKASNVVKPWWRNWYTRVT